MRPDEEDLWAPPSPYDEPPEVKLPVRLDEARVRSDDVEGWRRAEAAEARALAEAAAALARLDEAVRRGPPGFARRLAILEAAALLRAEGEAVRLEHVALVQAGAPAGGGARAAEAAARGAWAAGRLLASAAPLAAAEEARGFLGRAPGGEGAARLRDLLARPGQAGGAAEAWAERQARLADAHPLVRAAAGFAGWRRIAGSGAVAEPALLAARLAADGLRALTFAPLALADARALGRVRSVEDLAAFLRMTGQGAAQAQAQLERVEAWVARMAEAGEGEAARRRRAALAAHLAATPASSAATAAAALGVSTRTAERLLARVEAEGLVRELTGQARWRFWTARA